MVPWWSTYRRKAIRSFDLTWPEGHDVLDTEDYAAAARGCDAIVHAAGGQRPDAADSGQRFITHNVTGNWNMLEAAHNASIGRVVTFSSVNAIGVFRGEAAPDYLPIDDDHQIRPPTAYGMAKRLIVRGVVPLLYRDHWSRDGVLPPARGLRPGSSCQVRAAARAADPAAGVGRLTGNAWAWIDARDVAGVMYAALHRSGTDAS